MVSKVRRSGSVMAAAALTVAALTVGGCGPASKSSGSAAPASQPSSADEAASTPSAAPPSAATAAAAVKKWDPTKDNACDLLTEDAVTVALGIDPGPGKFSAHFADADFQIPPGGTDGGGCVYGANTVSALIRIIRFADKPPAEAFSCGEPKCTKVAGMGDEGYVAGNTTGAPTMIVIAEGPLFLQAGIYSTRETWKEDAITLGKNIAARF